MLKIALLLLIIPLLCGCNNKNIANSSQIPPGAIPGSNYVPEKPQELTLKSIAKMSDDELESTVSGKADSKVNWDASTWPERIAKLSDGEKTVFITMNLEGEVYNGGFQQYFCNTNGELAVDTLEAYKKIGATKHVAIVSKAIAIAAKEADLRKSIKASKDQLKAFTESYKQTDLNELDKVFWHVDEKEEFPRALRAKYIRAHASEFVKK